MQITRSGHASSIVPHRPIDKPAISPDAKRPARQSAVTNAVATPPRAQVTEAPNAAAKGQATSPPPVPPYNDEDLQNLMNDWGKSESLYDLNRDSTVDVNDLLILIGNFQSSSSQGGGSCGQGGSGGTGGSNGVGEAGGAPTSDQSAVEGIDKPLLIGKPDAGSPVDAGLLGETKPDSIGYNKPLAIDGGGFTKPLPVDGEGFTKPFAIDETGLEKPLVVEGDGLAKPLNLGAPISLAAVDDSQDELGLVGIEKPLHIEHPPRTAVGRDILNSALRAYGQVGAQPSSTQKLADSLVDRLMAAGFTAQPPTNLSELMKGLNLARGESSDVLARLNERYGERAGINTVA